MGDKRSGVQGATPLQEGRRVALRKSAVMVAAENIDVFQGLLKGAPSKPQLATRTRPRTHKTNLRLGLLPEDTHTNLALCLDRDYLPLIASQFLSG